MNDVAQQGRTVLFVSHNMSAILRLTQEAIVLKKGLIKHAPTPEAVDFYLSSGQAESGERVWEADEVPATSAPFRQVAIRIRERSGKVVDTVRSTEPVTIEWEYKLEAPVTGLRVGMYLNTMRGEYVFTAFDTDDASQYEQFGSRTAGRYVRRCEIPADFFNEGRYYLGVNASSFGGAALLHGRERNLVQRGHFRRARHAVARAPEDVPARLPWSSAEKVVQDRLGCMGISR